MPSKSPPFRSPGLIALAIAALLSTASCSPPFPASSCISDKDCPNGYACSAMYKLCVEEEDAGSNLVTDARVVDGHHDDRHGRPDSRGSDGQRRDARQWDHGPGDAGAPDALADGGALDVRADAGALDAPADAGSDAAPIADASTDTALVVEAGAEAGGDGHIPDAFPEVGVPDAGALPPDLLMIFTFLGPGEFSASVDVAGAALLPEWLFPDQSSSTSSSASYTTLGEGVFHVVLAPSGLGASIDELRAEQANLIRIPDGLDQLSSAQVIDLSENFIVAELPTWLGQMSTLEYLDLSDNMLWGPIPQELGDLSALTVLKLGDNALEGEIPLALGSLTLLERLELDGNELNGGIPLALEALVNLREVHLNDNQLVGDIPGSVLLGWPSLTTLNLGFNQLTGPVPAELGDLSSLTYINLEANLLEGGIPSTLGGLSHLTVLRLDKNDLSGSIPDSLGQLMSLEVLELDQNALTGGIPPALGRLDKLRVLELDNNFGLGGTVPRDLGDLTMLEVLKLNDCGLAGLVPVELGTLKFLRELSLDNNAFSGVEAGAFGYLERIEEIGIADSQLRQEAVNSVIKDIYNFRDQFVSQVQPVLWIGGNNEAPSGSYASPSAGDDQNWVFTLDGWEPISAQAMAYDLEHDVRGEGFTRWVVDFNP